MTTTKFLVKPASIKIKEKMHKPMPVVAPLWKKRVLRSQEWFIRDCQLLER